MDKKLASNLDKMSLNASLDQIKSEVAAVESELGILEQSQSNGKGISLRKEFLDSQLAELSETGLKIQTKINKL